MNIEKSVSRREFLKIMASGVAASFTFGFNEYDSNLMSNFESGPFRIGEIISKIKTDKNQFALTIDDGWDPDTLNEMLDLMKLKDFRSTFFLTGTAAIGCEMKFPGIIKRVVEEGHSIGYHTMNHPDKEVIVDASLEWWREDFDNWWQLMRNHLLGAEFANKGLMRYARAPYGEFTDSFLELCKRANLKIFAWNKDLFDMEKGVHLDSGDILLLHVKPRDLEFMIRGFPTTDIYKRASSLDFFEREVDSLPSDHLINELLKVLRVKPRRSILAR